MKKTVTLLTATFGIIFLLQACGSKNTEAETSTSCDKTKEDYQSGYKAGQAQAILVSAGTGGTSDADTYLATTNNGYGPIGTISDCWKEGFDNGFKEAK